MRRLLFVAERAGGACLENRAIDGAANMFSTFMFGLIVDDENGSAATRMVLPLATTTTRPPESMDNRR